MVRLRTLVDAPRGVFYALPLLRTTLEISKNPNVLAQSRLLDVAMLPSTIPPPTTKSGITRKSQLHYIDAFDAHAEVHSEPFNVPLMEAPALLHDVEDLPSVADWFQGSFESFGALRRALGPGALGAAMLPAKQAV
jgi:hypothetical protein